MWFYFQLHFSHRFYSFIPSCFCAGRCGSLLYFLENLKNGRQQTLCPPECKSVLILIKTFSRLRQNRAPFVISLVKSTYQSRLMWPGWLQRRHQISCWAPPWTSEAILVLGQLRAMCPETLQRLQTGSLGHSRARCPGMRQFLQAVSFMHSDATCPGMQQLLHIFGFLSTLASGQSRATCPYLYYCLISVTLFMLFLFTTRSYASQIIVKSSQFIKLEKVFCFFVSKLHSTLHFLQKALHKQPNETRIRIPSLILVQFWR